MGALAKIRQAGFEVALDGDHLRIRPSTGLSKEQRTFLKEHKAAVIAELRMEQEVILPAGPVCCGDCRHAVLLPDTDPAFGWRRCGLGVDDGGGFARQERRCGQFAV